MRIFPNCCKLQKSREIRNYIFFKLSRFCDMIMIWTDLCLQCLKLTCVNLAAIRRTRIVTCQSAHTPHPLYIVGAWSAARSDAVTINTKPVGTASGFSHSVCKPIWCM